GLAPNFLLRTSSFCSRRGKIGGGNRGQSTILDRLAIVSAANVFQHWCGRYRTAGGRAGPSSTRRVFDRIYFNSTGFFASSTSLSNRGSSRIASHQGCKRNCPYVM